MASAVFVQLMQRMAAAATPWLAGSAALPFTFGDYSGSHSEKYRLEIEPVEGEGTRPSGLFGSNDNEGETFMGAGKVATVTVYAVNGVTVCRPDDPSWTELEESPSHQEMPAVLQRESCSRGSQIAVLLAMSARG